MFKIVHMSGSDKSPYFTPIYKAVLLKCRLLLTSVLFITQKIWIIEILVVMDEEYIVISYYPNPTVNIVKGDEGPYLNREYHC